MPDRWSRFAPLTGVVFVVLLFGTFALGANSPGVHANGLKVIAHYRAHHGNAMATDFAAVVGLAFLLFFAASLRAHLRTIEGGENLATLGLAGAVVLAVGGASFSSLDWALADARNSLDPAAAQALNVLANDFFWPFSLGTAVFAIGNGLAIIRSRALPAWLGWVALVLGIVAITPLGFFAFLALMAWSLTVSVLLVVRFGRPPVSTPPVAARGGA